MKSESRANLIFLAVFLGVSLPGGVMLFRKRLDPTLRPSDLPESVQTRLPYMCPLPAGPDVRRFVPDATGAWLEQAYREQGGTGAMLTVDGSPVVSDDRVLQLLSWEATRTGARATALLWEPPAGATGAGDFTARIVAGAAPTDAQVTAARLLPLPAAVRKELVRAGYAKPPLAAMWVELRWAATPAGAAPAVSLVARGGSEVAAHIVRSPVPPGGP